MDALQDKLKPIRAKLDKVPLLQEAEDKLHVRKEYLVLGSGFVLAVIVLYGVGIGSLCSIVGFLYPAFKSFQALETKNKGDDTQWLVYWVIFAFFQIIEVFIDFLVYFIPFYYAFKLAFLLWLMLPQTKGAAFLYDSVLKDFLKKNESRIDAAMADAKKQAGSIASEFTSNVSDNVSPLAAAATFDDGEGKKDD